VGFGGHHLGDAPDERTAVRLVRQAVDGRVTFFDNCWEYHRGKTEAWMGAGLDGVRDRVFLMTKVQRHPHKHSAISPFRYPEMYLVFNRCSSQCVGCPCVYAGTRLRLRC
jgi:aryl-alcohol dehydrogenase-like predicted oxidoreductase